MIRAILDTNVLASGIVGAGNSVSPPAALIQHWRMQTFSLVVSDHLLGELDRTLGKPYFAQRILAQQRERLIWTIRMQAEVTPITVVVAGIATHPEDDLVLAAVATAGVDYLITGDRKLQALGRFGAAQIISPATFASLLEQALQPPPDDEN